MSALGSRLKPGHSSTTQGPEVVLPPRGQLQILGSIPSCSSSPTHTPAIASGQTPPQATSSCGGGNRKSGNPGLAEPWGPSRDGLGLPSWCTCSSGSPSPASCPLPELRCAKGWIRVWPKLSRSSCSAQWTCCSASLAPLHLALALLLEQRAVSLPSHFCPAQRAPPTDQSPAFSPSHRSRRRYLWPLWTPFS